MDKNFADDPRLAAIYRKLGGETDRDPAPYTKFSLFSVSLMPAERDCLPASAIEQRQQMLKEALDFLGDTHQRVTRDAVLLAAVDSYLDELFLPYLAAQTSLLRMHLDGIEIGTMSAGPIRPARSATTAFAAFRQPDVSGLIQSPSAVTGTASGADPNPEKLPTSAEATNPLDRSGVEAAARELRIPHLVHFTRSENLPSILRHGLKSVVACEREELVPMRNDQHRFDAQQDGTSLSVTFPNYRMFYKYRKLAPGTDWAVLLISPRVIWEKDCAFYRHNAADARMIRQHRGQKKSAQALRDMFAADDGDRDAGLRSYDPTDPQAEILVYESIEPSLIEAIAFETADAHTRHMQLLGRHESFFAGTSKGLFGPRQQILTNRSRG